MVHLKLIAADKDTVKSVFVRTSSCFARTETRITFHMEQQQLKVSGSCEPSLCVEDILAVMVEQCQAFGGQKSDLLEHL